MYHQCEATIAITLGSNRPHVLRGNSGYSIQKVSTRTNIWTGNRTPYSASPATVCRLCDGRRRCFRPSPYEEDRKRYKGDTREDNDSQTLHKNSPCLFYASMD